MDFVMRLKRVAQIGFALGVGLYLAAQLLAPVYAGPRESPRNPGPAVLVIQGESLSRIVEPHRLRVITRTS